MNVRRRWLTFITLGDTIPLSVNVSMKWSVNSMILTRIHICARKSVPDSEFRSWIQQHSNVEERPWPRRCPKRRACIKDLDRSRAIDSAATEVKQFGRHSHIWIRFYFATLFLVLSQVASRLCGLCTGYKRATLKNANLPNHRSLLLQWLWTRLNTMLEFYRPFYGRAREIGVNWKNCGLKSIPGIIHNRKGVLQPTRF